jgi:hypothetical protein
MNALLKVSVKWKNVSVKWGMITRINLIYHFHRLRRGMFFHARYMCVVFVLKKLVVQSNLNACAWT